MTQLLFEDPVMDRLVEEVAKGIRQVLLYFGENKNSTLGDAVQAAYRDRDEAAEEWIFEFIKDGIRTELIEDARTESEAVFLHRVMGFTRPYLERFCACRYSARNNGSFVPDPWFCAIHKDEKVLPYAEA